MKTVLVDNSLCVYTLSDDVNPEFIYRYIEALRDAGVKYIELDFRALMKLHELPQGIGYIFRMIDPMFLRLCEMFEFDYIHLTLDDVRKDIKTEIPVALGFPVGQNMNPKAFYYANRLMDGKIALVRLSGSFPFLGHESAKNYINRLKNEVPVPIDICPMNGRFNALDMAVKFTSSGIDSLTLPLGQSRKYCALEDYMFTLMSVFNMLPGDFILSSVCKAAIYQQKIFKNADDRIKQLFALLDKDYRALRNVDTGQRVHMRVGVKNSEHIIKTYDSALKRMASEAGIPEDIFYCIEDAISCFDVTLCSSEVYEVKKRAFLN